MNLTKRVRCFFRLNSAWAQCSAVCMGLSIFIRAVYYFGITNFNDLTGSILATHVILPLVLAVGYLIMLRGLRFNSPVLMGVLSIGFAVNYLLITDGSGPSVLGAALLILTAALLIVTGRGILTTRIPLLLLALATLLYRVIVIDWNLYLNSPEGFHLLGYLPEVSNLFGLLAILVMCPCVRLVPLQRHVSHVREEAPAVTEEPAAEPVQTPEHIAEESETVSDEAAEGFCEVQDPGEPAEKSSVEDEAVGCPDAVHIPSEEDKEI